MSTDLFSFVQLEFPWALGPADGRYPLRDVAAGEVSHVLVLTTLGAPQRRLLGARRKRTEALSQPAPVTTARVTVIDSRPVEEDAARRRLAALDAHGAADEALGVVNRLIYAHRLASADPAVHELSSSHALVVRAGFGSGEQVARGEWREAQTLVAPRERHGRRRTAAMRPQERLAALLGARVPPLLGEELRLRARLDLDHGRPRHAALELEQAYSVLLDELRAEQRPDLAERLRELGELAAGVRAAAGRVRSGGEPETQPLEQALTRAEAALRARAATGFQRDAHGDA